MKMFLVKNFPSRYANGMNKVRFTFLAIALALLLNPVNGRADNTAVLPARRDADWIKRHESFLAEAKRGPVDLVFLGDSITDWWRHAAGKPVWDKYYAPRRALNLGIGSDRTQHVLWRLQHGALSGIKPKVVVLLIGVNNLPALYVGDPRNTVPEVIEGIGAVVKEIRKQSPRTKILLLGIFPIRQKGDPLREAVKEVNQGIAKFAKGKKVQFLDIGEKFLEPDGSISTAIMPDLVHPSEKGYRIWAEAMEPTLAKMMK